ncbi:lipase secretion chaperone [Litoribrevibacter euphylliae]|uniref:Lipase chaperone n=1 Tax=Litoribrevibacter euphylliae TaxID=1834034 RepID=A0ABV7HMY7_9GAMM
MKTSLKVTVCGLMAVMAGLAVMSMTFENQRASSDSKFSESHSLNEREVVTSRENITDAAGNLKPEAVVSDNKGAQQVIEWQAALPSQFQGTRVVGALEVDEQGNLIVNSQAKQVLDYFFTAQDDASIEEITTWLEAYFSEQLVSPAREQASRFLAQYIDYKTQLNQLAVEPDVWGRLYDPGQLVTPSDLTSLTRVFHEREALQSQVFDQATQAALFGEENDYDELMLKRLHVSLSDASEAEIQQQLASLDQQLPQVQQVEREASQLAIHHKELSEDIAGSDSATQYQAYAQTYGDEAAARLIALAERRKAFDQKRALVEAYRDALGENASAQALNDYMKYELGLSNGDIQRINTLEQIAK